MLPKIQSNSAYWSLFLKATPMSSWQRALKPGSPDTQGQTKSLHPAHKEWALSETRAASISNFSVLGRAVGWSVCFIFGPLKVTEWSEQLSLSSELNLYLDLPYQTNLSMSSFAWYSNDWPKWYWCVKKSWQFLKLLLSFDGNFSPHYSAHN